MSRSSLGVGVGAARARPHYCRKRRLEHGFGDIRNGTTSRSFTGSGAGTLLARQDRCCEAVGSPDSPAQHRGRNRRLTSRLRIRSPAL
jgi:hypothetical protein